MVHSAELMLYLLMNSDPWCEFVYMYRMYCVLHLRVLLCVLLGIRLVKQWKVEYFVKMLRQISTFDVILCIPDVINS